MDTGGYHVIEQVASSRFVRGRAYSGSSTPASYLPDVIPRTYTDTPVTSRASTRPSSSRATTLRGSIRNGKVEWQSDDSEYWGPKASRVDYWYSLPAEPRDSRSRWRRPSFWIWLIAVFLASALVAVLVPVLLLKGRHHASLNSLAASTSAGQGAPASPFEDGSSNSTTLSSTATPTVTSTQTVTQATTLYTTATATVTATATEYVTVTLQRATTVQSVQTTYNNALSSTLTTSRPVTTTQLYTATLASTTAPAATVTAALSSSSTIYTNAFATFFFQDNTEGACGVLHTDSDHIVAIDSAMYDNGANCGRTVQIRRLSTGVVITATVADECPTCDTSTSLDLSVASFLEIATEEEGEVAIEWQFV
ncbi:hypothetical protein T439DRAFT_380795 [Meredithblackwellia eburnea MCA 4105]